MISQWVGYVTIYTTLSCNQERLSFTQDASCPVYFAQDPGVRKMWMFLSKTESSHTSQDKK